MWKATKTLSFDSICEQLTSLKLRLSQQGKVVEFIIDNCSWRQELQSIFGRDMKVSLDLFHAVQRISSKLSKRHSFHGPCLHDPSMVFRDPSDQGLVRTMVTPSPHVLIENLKKFTKKWKDTLLWTASFNTKCGQRIKCHSEAYGEGMFVWYTKVGRGTNRNERLHRHLNCVLKANRYGPEMASALITLTLFKHDENVLAKTVCRVANPVEAYGCFSTDSESEIRSTECFGLCSPNSIESIIECNPAPCKCFLKDLNYDEVRAIFESVFSSLDGDNPYLGEEGSSTDSEFSLSSYDALVYFYREQ